MSVIVLDGIYTAYEGGKKAVIRDLSLRVDRGEYVVIGGPNSAGKTTLLESINGLIKINHGRRRSAAWMSLPKLMRCERG